MTDTWIPVAAAAIGACAALLGQMVTMRSSSVRHEREIAQREREAQLRFLEPIRDRRLHACETFYDILQGLLEGDQLSEESYLMVRKLFAYLDDSTRTALIDSLRPVVSAGSVSNVDRARIKEIQARIRNDMTTPLS